MQTWVQATNPLGNIGLSALVAAIPILILFYCLAVRKMKGHTAGILTLVVAIIIAVAVYGMPAKLAVLSTVYGMLDGLFPIGWIVLFAVFLYNLTVKSGQFDVIKDSISSLTEDRRLQLLLIGYCFGSFLEGAAGFGAPVAITAGMLAGLGFNPFYAAGLCLLADTAPVAFGGVGIPIITAGQVAGIDPNIISKMAVHQLPLLSFIVPFWLVITMSGWKGMKEVLPAILVVSTSFTVSMWVVAEFVGPMLPNIVSSLVSIVCLVIFLKIWKPKNIWRFENEPPATLKAGSSHSTAQVVKAWSPYIVLTIMVANWGVSSVQSILNKVTEKIPFPGLDKAILVGGKAMSVIFTLNWISATGTGIFIAAIISAIFLKISPAKFIGTFFETLNNLKFALLTIAAVLGFAFIANYSGMTAVMGRALTVTGNFFPFVAPFLGFLGVFLTGSDTSSNALFCNLQKITATQIGVNPVLTVTANTSGGVAAKMISPQSIAVATASVNLLGQEGELFRFTFKHSIAFTAIMGAVTYIQAYFLTGMIPKAVAIGKTAAAAATGGGTVLLITAVVLIALGIFTLCIKDNLKPGLH